MRQHNVIDGVAAAASRNGISSRGVHGGMPYHIDWLGAAVDALPVGDLRGSRCGIHAVLTPGRQA